MIGVEKEKLLRYRRCIQTLVAQCFPAGKQVDAILQNLADRWNPLFDPQQRMNLVEDVNALVRDFLRPLKNSLFITPPDLNRIHDLAEQISGSETLAKITRKDALTRYLEVYLVKILDSTQQREQRHGMPSNPAGVVSKWRKP